MTRPGVVLPLALLALLALATAAAGAAWAAQALGRAEVAALEAESRWRQADALLMAWPCDSVPDARVTVSRVPTASGEATVRSHHMGGVCWVSVAVGDTIPLVGGFLTAQNRGVTQEANTTPVVLPSIEAVAELATRTPAPPSGPSQVVVVPPGSGLLWRDLR